MAAVSAFPVRVTVSVAFEDIPFDTETAVGIVERLLRERTKSAATVNLVFAGHALVRQLHRDYLNHDSETDVLSFNLTEPAEPLEGEVYIDVETANERCREFDASLEEELARYAVHGVLHLLGMNDATEAERDEMRRVENEYLTAEFGRDAS